MTTDQLFDRWRSEMYFGPNYRDEDTPNVRGSHMAGIGNNSKRVEFTGKVIGTISIDPETKEMKIEPFADDEEKDENPEA